jgi:hypothetical protein
MSEYSKYDLILNAWSERHGLGKICTTYKGDEVRTTSIVSSIGEMFQVWLGVPGENNEISVHVWDYKERRKDWKNVPMHQLDAALESAFQTAKSWMKPSN